MKQLLLRKGKIKIEEVPPPALGSKQVLVSVLHSLISTGTELTSVRLSGASLIGKAKERPKEVKKVLDSIKVRGVKKTFALVQSKLDESKPLGYSCSGVVIATGKDVLQFKPGDRVACAGAALANHAEVVSVPENLVAPVPSGVDMKYASMVTLGAIALQGVRRADLRLGETAAVLGLGLIGQITVQLLAAAGCRVLGMDIDPRRVALARHHGLDDGAASASEFLQKTAFATQGHGADATIITASTPSDEPARQAFEITRKKGKIVVVGAVGMNLERSPFYEKEQDFLISCSYGPGRYDASYEKDGIDYPYSYVRWTENRNMRAFLELLEKGRLDLSGLAEKEFTIEEAEKAYDYLKGEGASLAALINYPGKNGRDSSRSAVKKPSLPPLKGKIKVGLVGIGNFTQSTHIPNLAQAGKDNVITAVCGQKSASVATIGRQLKAGLQTTNPCDIFSSSDVDAVFITTRHDTHASLAKEALLKGKHVYLEKPLALTREELEDLDQTLSSLEKQPTLMVGFNRRFAPHTKQVQAWLKKRNSPALIHFRVNAGALPADHWSKTAEGGGRLRGEACHMIDFFKAVLGSRIESMSIEALGGDGAHLRADENFSARFKFEEGSIADLEYLSNGHKSLPKERVEIHCGGSSMVIDDFKTLKGYGAPGSHTLGSQDKGHLNAVKTFFDAIRSGAPSPISWDDLRETTLAAIELNDEVMGHLPS